MYRRKLSLILAIVLITLTVSVVIAAARQPEPGLVAQTDTLTGPPINSPHYELDWNITANGGGTVSSTHFQVSSTIGQPATGFSGSANFEVCSGFWCKVLAFFELYLPIQLRN
jgi:hypothetical protein